VPAPVAYVRDLLHGFGPTWLLGGGWAADAWLGRTTREHWDVDIIVFHDEQQAVRRHFPDWALVGHDPNVPDETSEPWTGRHLDLPAHIHVPKLGSPLAGAPTVRHAEYEFEFLLNERAAGEWVLSRHPRITVALDRCTPRPGWDVPAVPPEVVLFHKAGGHLGSEQRPARPRDEQDFRALFPQLTAAQRTWFRESLGRVRPGHPWLRTDA
jgi:hypothetical protein